MDLSFPSRLDFFFYIDLLNCQLAKVTRYDKYFTATLALFSNLHNYDGTA